MSSSPTSASLLPSALVFSSGRGGGAGQFVVVLQKCTEYSYLNAIRNYLIYVSIYVMLLLSYLKYSSEYTNLLPIDYIFLKK